MAQEKKPKKTNRRATIASRKVNAIPLLAMGLSAKQVAEKVGANVKNVYDWLRDQEYRDAVIEERTRYLDQAAGIFAASITAAVNKIRSLITSGNESIALGASRTLLDYSIKYYHMVHLESRLRQLEEKQKQQQQAGGAWEDVPTIEQPTEPYRFEDDAGHPSGS